MALFDNHKENRDEPVEPDDPDKPATEDPKPEDSKPTPPMNIPQTGDNTIALWLSLMAIGLCGIITSIFLNKKGSKKGRCDR